MSLDSFNIGIDFGGVLSAHDATIGAEHVNTAIDIPLAVDNLLKLRGLGHKLFLISFCGKSRAVETIKSLKDSYISAGISCADLFSGIFFVKDKKFKKEMCEYLNCHFMVDDREDILQSINESLCKTVPILFGTEETQTNFKTASNWNQVTEIILSTPHFSTSSTSLSIEKPIKLLYDI